MKNKFRFSLVVFLIVVLGCFTSIFAAANNDGAEIGTANLGNTVENSAKVGNTLYHPEKGWKRYDDTDTRMLSKGDFYNWADKGYYNGSIKYGKGTVLIKFYGSKFRIIMHYFPDRSNNNFVYVDNTKLGQFNEIGDSVVQAIGFEKTGLNEGIHILRIDLGNNSTLDALDIDDTGYLIQLAKGITLSKTTDELLTNQNDTLTTTVTPDNTANKSIAWTSSDESIATVDQTGKITALKAGQVNITATTQDGSDLSASCVVTVKEPTAINLNKTTDSLTVGDTDTLTAKVTPDDIASKGVIWSSSDESTVKVVNGTLTAVKAGTVTVTATTADGKTATCTVTVKDPTTISLNKTTDCLTVGDTDTLTAKVTPADIASKGVTWSSSDESTVKVVNGTLTAVKAGTATVTATTADGKTATCTVTVVDQESSKNKLTVYMRNEVTREYYLTENEIDDFINWYNARANNQTTKAYYIINVPSQGTSSAKKDYLLFDKILIFSVE
ncbi:MULTISPECIES: Ig-like domain-containing protein [Clostridium]|uniref:Ig-like domain-containing protein n=1 Tax=Clostridium TaxID=1485 RepID=UPI0008241FEF|nr:MULTISPECIES: Ig domain-containing protein [Clostridium]PJI07775.1 cell adhesion protein [Clostridium sp. CT7]